MKPKLLLCLAFILSLVLAGCTTAPSARSFAPSGGNTDVDKDLSKRISDILTDCQKIKPGMTRAQLLKVFTTEGGLSTAAWRTFDYRGCPYIKVDVDFTPSDPKQKMVEERPTDTISKISKPYLDWIFID